MLVKPAPGRFRKDRFDAKLFGKFPAEFNVGPGTFPGGIVVGKRRIDALGVDSQFPGAGNFVGEVFSGSLRNGRRIGRASSTTAGLSSDFINKKAIHSL